MMFVNAPGLRKDNIMILGTGTLKKNRYPCIFVFKLFYMSLIFLHKKILNLKKAFTLLNGL